ncbi:hypothetical protein DUI87_35251 [Hirundo rustica rustica]|uniref:Uncharacterized protein n=1 Tax=Hirundo rustica rustica TaxID=333673 RepID=A0A3M0IHY7_HIRRU|nr:hypothetical protein DUI87_35251 [Hirundo rustica rustica]
MALALRLILLLLLAVALPARTAQAAPWRAQGAVKPEGEDDLDSQPTSKTETLGDAEVKPEGEGDLDSQPTSKTETLGDAEVMDQKSVHKEELPRESSGSVAASAAERKEMADTNTVTDADKARADWYRDMDYLEMMANGGLKAGPEAEGKSATQLL